MRLIILITVFLLSSNSFSSEVIAYSCLKSEVEQPEATEPPTFFGETAEETTSQAPSYIVLELIRPKSDDTLNNNSMKIIDYGAFTIKESIDFPINIKGPSLNPDNYVHDSAELVVSIDNSFTGISGLVNVKISEGFSGLSHSKYGEDHPIDFVVELYTVYTHQSHYDFVQTGSDIIKREYHHAAYRCTQSHKLSRFDMFKRFVQ